jgi:hypothetical protein
MKIYIPTYLREERQNALNNLPDSIKEMVTLVTHSGRALELRRATDQHEVIELPAADGIADVRQQILELSPDPKILIIDDQCRFKKRTPEMKYEKMSSEDYLELFGLIEKHLDLYAMVGISDRGGNNRLLEPTKEVARMYSVYGLNRDIIKEAGASFDGMWRKDNEIKLYEDFYLILKLLTSGYPNLLINNFVFETPHGVAGGNSTFRNNSTQLKCIQALQKEFPDFVKVVRKEDSSWTTDGEDTGRFEAQIAWKEAFKSSLVTGAGLEDFFG